MIDFTQKKFGIISLGCDKNRVDSEKLLSIIKEGGGKLTDDISKANVLVVNTCAFLNEKGSDRNYSGLRLIQGRKSGKACRNRVLAAKIRGGNFSVADRSRRVSRYERLR